MFITHTQKGLIHRSATAQNEQKRREFLLYREAIVRDATQVRLFPVGTILQEYVKSKPKPGKKKDPTSEVEVIPWEYKCRMQSDLKNLWNEAQLFTVKKGGMLLPGRPSLRGPTRLRDPRSQGALLSS